MDFGSNVTSVEVIKRGTFGGSYFGGISLLLMINGIKNHGIN